MNESLQLEVSLIVCHGRLGRDLQQGLTELLQAYICPLKMASFTAGGGKDGEDGITLQKYEKLDEDTTAKAEIGRLLMLNPYLISKLEFVHYCV